MSFLKPNNFFHLFILVLLSFSLTACGGGSGGSASDPVTPDVSLDSIQVIPQQVELASGLQQSFQAIGNYSDGSTKDISQEVEWLSSNTQVAQVTAAVAVSNAAGTATISATLNGVSGQASLSVNSAILQSIEIIVNNPSLPVGLSSSITILGFYSDQTISDVTALASLESDDAALVSIDSATAMVKAIAIGQTTIRADISGIQDEMALQVNDAVLSKIEISPENSTIAAGYKQQFTATGIYNDQSSWDLTGLVSWDSSDELIAEVDNRLQTKGEVTAIKEGSAELSALFDGKSASTGLMVNNASLMNIDVTPANSTVAVSLQRQFEAIALYSDGSQKVVTDQVEWSSDSKIASLVSSSNPGLFKTNSPGDVLLIAKLNNKQGFTNLKISDATLDSLNVVAVTDKQALGTSQKLTANAKFSDGSELDVTDQVSWVSTDASVAHVSNASGNRGLVTALSAGTVSISAHMGSISSSQTLEVSAGILQQIQLSVSSEAPLYINQQRSLDAIGIYSDGSEQNLTQQVQWVSSDEQIIDVSTASESPGLLTALSAGSASVSASFAGVTANALPFQVIDNPDYPASISLLASPNVILNDGADSTTLQATVRPLQASGAIEDGTVVNFSILENEVTRNETATTTGGVASIKLTSVNVGSILVTAEVADTDINATTTINSTNNFARVLLIGKSAEIIMSSDKSTYLPGSKFFLYLRNLSNRDFNILAFWARLDGENFTDTPVKDPKYLSDGVLEGGEYTSAGYQLDQEVTADKTISTGYLLSDTATNKVFFFTVDYTVP